MTSNHYIIDTSSLIHLNRYNPIDVYPTVWNRMSNLRREGLLHSVFEVYNEIHRKDDALRLWTIENRRMFVKETEIQMYHVSEILRNYSALINTEGTFQADPWIIAMALEMRSSNQQKLFAEKIIIITEEKLKGQKVRIPLVCNNYDLDYLSVFDLFRQEGWQF